MLLDGFTFLLLAGILSAVDFYFVSRALLNKQYKKITYLTPALGLTILTFIFLVLSFVFGKDGWVNLGIYFYSVFIIAGTFLGTFLPFIIHSKYRRYI